MSKLGTVKRSKDKDDREIRERLEVVVECDTCGKDVELWSDTESWIEVDGEWKHQFYGPAQGVCCEWLYVSSFEGCFRYHLGPPEDRYHRHIAEGLR